MRAEMEKSSEEVALLPEGAKVSVAETAQLERGARRARLVAPCAGWCTLKMLKKVPKVLEHLGRDYLRQPEQQAAAMLPPGLLLARMGDVIPEPLRDSDLDATDVTWTITYRAARAGPIFRFT